MAQLQCHCSRNIFDCMPLVILSYIHDMIIYHTHHEMILGGRRQSVTGEFSVAFEGLAQLHVDVLCWIVSHSFTAVTSCVMGRPMYFFSLQYKLLYDTESRSVLDWFMQKLKLRV